MLRAAALHWIDQAERLHALEHIAVGSTAFFGDGTAEFVVASGASFAVPTKFWVEEDNWSASRVNCVELFMALLAYMALAVCSAPRGAKVKGLDPDVLLTWRSSVLDASSLLTEAAYQRMRGLVQSLPVVDICPGQWSEMRILEVWHGGRLLVFSRHG